MAAPPARDAPLAAAEPPTPASPAGTAILITFGHPLWTTYRLVGIMNANARHR
ncbi:hypothetical protein [Streptomyces longispororuber]|uniref:hypothetical protein n=1 Tax=Streptomyces longispororuber TaxID=68230 RepID=UPI0036F7DEBC